MIRIYLERYEQAGCEHDRRVNAHLDIEVPDLEDALRKGWIVISAIAEDPAPAPAKEEKADG